MSRRSKGRIALLYDCTYPHIPGGGQKRLFEIFSRLVEMGWQVDWYGTKGWPEPGETEHQGIRYIPVGKARPLYTSDGKRSISPTLFYGLAITRHPRLGQYDIVHLGQWPYFHFFPVKFYALFGGAKTCVDWWEVWSKHWLDYYGTKGLAGMALEWICARVPNKLIAISETGANELANLVGKGGADRISIVHNGIDHSAIRQADRAETTSDLIYLGRLQPHKNVNLLISALDILHRAGTSLTLKVIGEGPEKQNLMELANTLGVGHLVQWLGAVQADAEVYAHLKSARVFVHPSTKEGGGSITSLEANAAGLPVVAFAVPGGISSELIESGQNGVWVSSADSQALADGIMDALAQSDNPQGPQNCVEFARKFDWSGLASSYDDLFSRMLVAQ